MSPNFCLNAVQFGALFGSLMLLGHKGQVDVPSKAQSDQKHSLPAPVLDTHEFMELFNEQWLIYAREAMAEEPADEEAWKSIQDRGYQLAEIASLIAIRKVDRKHTEQWQKHSQQVRETALKWTEAAKSKDWKKTRSSYEAAIQSCNACHSEVAPGHAPEITPFEE